MIKMLVVFVALFVVIGIAQVMWSTLDQEERQWVRRSSLRAAVIALIVTVILSVITILF